MNRTLNLETFPNSEAASEAAAQALIQRLRPAGEKRLMVTGGRSPGPVFDRLAQTDLDWSRVAITLSDERFVDPASPDSNERLVRERLLRGHAAAARFTPLKGPGPSAADDAAAAEPKVRVLLPFDASLLGMGDDGHIASLFPGTPGLAAALDPEGKRLVVGVESAGQPPYVPRISLTARALFDTQAVVLLVGGEGKRALLERALADPAFDLPVSALLNQTRAPVRILWSPAVA